MCKMFPFDEVIMMQVVRLKVFPCRVHVQSCSKLFGPLRLQLAINGVYSFSWKVLKLVLHALNVIFAEFHIPTMPRIAPMSMLANALFAAKIQVWQWLNDEMLISKWYFYHKRIGCNFITRTKLDNLRLIILLEITIKIWIVLHLMGQQPKYM